ncbi:MAG: VCBS repeat-containing protein [Planctomycetes bacterium]|nr:VCBS repeat-containing protein [Planctomycetota bacterium]
MSKRHTPRRRRTSAPTVRRSLFSRKLLLEPLEDRRMLAVVAGFDFGDARDPYPTTLADDGARHEAIGPMLGASRDEEADGQPTSDANGDGADEDGVTFGSIRVGQLDTRVTVNVQNAPDGAKLDAWIDFNGDGNWGGPGEQIFDHASVNSGDNALEFDVPSWAASGNTYARFRLSTAGDLGLGGPASDGEVEDYLLTIRPPGVAPGVFDGQNIISTAANGARSVFAADVDGDGDIDMLSASIWDNKIAWYENDGSGGFTAHTISSTASGARSVFAVDVDGDGDIDVLSASVWDDKIVWYENDGSEGFTAHTISSTAGSPTSVFAADVDGDGDIDVLSASFSNIVWYENDGSQRFTAFTISTDARGAQSVFAADVDGDGDIDVLSASSADDKIAWYENDGSEGFTARTISTAANGAVSVFAADLDGDGDIDVLSASLGDDKIVWYENDGSALFTAHTISTAADGAASVFAADLDGDGDIDVLSASVWDDKIAWYENDGSALFTAHTISTTASGARSVFAADVDGDGDLDVLSASGNDDKIAWYENIDPFRTGYPLPLAPLAPTGSLVYQTAARRSSEAVGDVDTLKVVLDAGQSVTVFIEPLGGLRAALEIRDSAGVLVGSATAATADQTLLLQTLPIAVTDTYTITVSGVDGRVGAFNSRVLLNAAVEAESHGGATNDDSSTAQSLAASFIPLVGSAERGAVLGSLEFGVLPVYEANMDVDPGWDLEGGWRYGQPTGRGSNNRDPLSGFTGPNVVGYNLRGDYPDNLRVQYATTPSFSTLGATGVSLSFMRWLGLEFCCDNAGIEVSNDGGSNWTTVWTGSSVDSTWTPQTFDISAIADDQPDVRLRWSMGPTDGSVTFPGWNIDDVLVSVKTPSMPDWYSFELADGQSASLALTALTGSGLLLDLYASDGTTHLASGVGAANAERVINNFVDGTSDGVASTYYVRVTGADADYSLVVTRDADFDSESNDDLPPEAQDISTSGTVLGHVGVGSSTGSSGPTPLGVNLTDGEGFLWDIQGDGNIINGTSDAFDGGLRHSGFPGFSTGNTEENRREIVIGPALVGSVEVTRKIYVPDDQGFARFLEIVTNNTESTQAYSLTINTNLGSDGGTVLVATSSGDARFDANDNWLVTDDADGSGDPTILHVMAGPGGLGPAAASTLGDDISYRYDLTLAPGATQIIMHFAAQSANRADAVDKAAQLVELGLGATEGLTAIEAGQIVNFVVGSDDFFSVSVNAGDMLTMSTTTPADGPGQFVNDLDPSIELFDPTGALVAVDDNGAADGRNALLNHSATLSGLYTVRLFEAGGTRGEYVLHVSGFTGGLPPFFVDSTMPADGSALTTTTTTFEVNFNDQVDLSTLQPGDLLVDGTPVTAFASVPDGDTVVFTLPALGDGMHTVDIAGGAILDLQGTAIDPFNAAFTVDTNGPRVIASSILQNDVLSTNTFVYTAQFSEPLLASLLDASDVRLVSQRNSVFAPTQFEYDDVSSTLMLGFDNLPDGFFTLTLRSGTNRFRDIAGNVLDGERHPTTTVPSGNGTAGGDFVVGFLMESGPPRVIDSSVRDGDVVNVGGLTYTARFDESLDAASVVAANVHLVGSTVGELVPTSVTYRASTSTLTATFSSLPVDQYVLTLRSGAGGLADASGKQLDGERNATTTVPSGDGTAGGDFVVNFSVIVIPELSGTITEDTVLRAGSGPWRVTGDVTVPAGVTLTIEPGVEVLFEPGVEMTVRGGRIVAVGTPEQRIRLAGVTEGTKWDGIHVRNSLQDNIFAYVDIDDAQSSDGSIGAFASVISIDHVTFAGSRRRYVRVVDASAIIRNSIFPDRFGPGQSPGGGDNNVVEMINGTGIMAGGQMIIEGNTFGTNKGHNDIIDFSGPVRPAPILQVLNNVFMGASDEMLDLGGDAYIEGNIFMHARRDEFNTSSGHTNAISTGDGPAGATIVLVRNVFVDVEHVINLKNDNFVVLEHNTIVGITPDGPDPGNGTLQEYSVVNLVIVNRDDPGRGAHLDGNIIVGVPERIFGNPDTAQSGNPGSPSDLIVSNTLLSTERCGDVIGQRDGTIMDLGTNILCGDPMLADVAGGDFSLLPGSPAIGAGVHGLDLGALVPAGATVSDVPAVVEEDFATFTVDGPGVIEYQFRLDSAPWSDAISVDELLELTDLADGAHRLEVVGMNYAGVWQDEADAVVRTWTVGSTVLPADLTGNGFVDFEDLTVLLAAWNQDVSAAEGNLVDADTTPVNFEDLTVLLAAWTGPGPAAAAVAAAVRSDRLQPVKGDRINPVTANTSDGVVMLKHNLRAARRDAAGSRPAGGTYGGMRRLQAVAVDRAMGEQETFERRGRTFERRRFRG